MTTTPEIRAFLHGPDPLIVTKANAKSVVHRRAYLDYIGVKTYDKRGRLSGELRIVGLFTSTAYTRSVLKIPYLRSKTEAVIAKSGFNPADHSGKALINVLEILSARRAVPDRRCRCCASMPRPSWRSASGRGCVCWCASTSSTASSRSSSSCRATATTAPCARRSATILKAALRRPACRPTIRPFRRAGWPASISSSAARAASTPKVEPRTLEAGIRDIVRTWEDGLREAAADSRRRPALARRWPARVPESYRGTFSPAEALVDAGRIAELERGQPDRHRLLPPHRPAGRPGGAEDLSFRRAGGALAARAGAGEHGFPGDQRAHLRGRRPAGTARSFSTTWSWRTPTAEPITLDDRGALFEDVFLSVWRGESDNDGYNALAQTAGMRVGEIGILRAYGRYLQQAGIPQSQDFIAAALNRYPDIARGAASRCSSPASTRPRRTKAAVDGAAPQGGDQGRAGSGAEHRRRHHHPPLPQSDRSVACAPTSSPRRREAERRSLAIKLESRADRRPAGAAALARDLRLRSRGRGRASALRPGGARRPALVGPGAGLPHRGARPGQGAAGQECGDRAGRRQGRLLPEAAAGRAAAASGVRGRHAPPMSTSSPACCRSPTISTATQVVPPAGVVRRDGDDPYFVVAADKGTATFSDTANGISQAHGFWLDDAFASGGSAGYDHKKMGITARGAWEAVKRHFREMDRDIQTTPFTVVGVGDMSGDVFGNGMLLSRADQADRRLRPSRHLHRSRSGSRAVSFAERQRLFALPRSSWQDYDKSTSSRRAASSSRAARSRSPCRPPPPRRSAWPRPPPRRSRS